MENVNITSGGHGMQQEENQCPWMGIWVCLILAWLSLFRFGYPCYWSWYVCVFVFLERTWCCLFGSDLGILLALVLGFLCVCFSREILGLWVCFWLSWLLVYGFISSVYLWFGLVSLDLIKVRFGCWIWIWGLLEIRFSCLKNTKNKFNLSPQTYVLKKQNNESKIIINKIRFKVFFFFQFSNMAF